MSGSSDGTDAAARFFNPQGITSDAAGNLYVADSGNDTIRKVVIATGAVSTLAGTAGMPGSSDGTGAAARFSYPIRVTNDGAGNLYIADTFNSTIRKVVITTGAVTTPIGVPGQLGVVPGPLPASLRCPSGVFAVSTKEIAITDACADAILTAHLQ
jgi:hypothetical protein